MQPVAKIDSALNLWGAFKLMAPYLPGYIVWGFVTGVAMVQGGLSTPVAATVSLLVYAGAAQVAALPLIVIGAPLWLITVTGLMVNLRFVIYSAVLAPYLSQLPLMRRVSYAFLNVDVSLGILLNYFDKLKKRGHSEIELRNIYEQSYFSVAVLMWVIWQSASFAGIFLSNYFPVEWQLDFLGLLVLLLVAAPLVIDKAAFIGVLCASVLSVVTIQWPFRLGIIFSTLTGMLISLAVLYTSNNLVSSKNNS